MSVEITDTNDAGPRPDVVPDPLRRNWVWFSIQVVLRNLFLFWFRYRARGHEQLPQTGGALFVINHQSHLDPLLVGLPLRRPVSYLARDNLFRVPVVGWILRNTYVVPIVRGGSGTTGIRTVSTRLQHGFFVGIFPEGTRTADGRLGELKPGFVSVARRANTVMVPVGIAGGYEAFPRGTFWLRPARVRVVFGTPISVQELAELTAKGSEQRFLELVASRLDQHRLEAEEWRRRDDLGA